MGELNIGRLRFKRAFDINALTDFNCGVKALDDFIHDRKKGLEKLISLRLSNLWIVFNDLEDSSEVIGFFALSKDALILNNMDLKNLRTESKEEDDEEQFWDQEKYSAIEIDYIAIQEKYRNHHIGSDIINLIADRAANDPLSATLFLTVEALDTKEYSAVPFYRQCNFLPSELAKNKQIYNQIHQGIMPTTQRMYKLILPLQ